jgi:hypothetical protein
MNAEDTNTPIPPKAEQESKTRSKNTGTKKPAGKVLMRSLFDIINGNILTNKQSLRQVPFMLFITGLTLLYIANSYYAEKKIRQINKVTNELKELRSEYITSKSKLMFVSKQSEVAKTAESMGLEIRESINPPGKIIVK